jgi:hypothetical protein
MLVLPLRSVEHQTVEFNEWFKGGLTSEVDNAVLAREWLKTPRGRWAPASAPRLALAERIRYHRNLVLLRSQ